MAIKTNVKASDRLKWQKQIRLLSGGYTNPKVFPDGMVSIRPWDMLMDEWALKHQNMEQTAFMIEAVRRLIDVPPDFDLKTMLYGDMSTIILVGRGLRMNSIYPLAPVCPQCKRKHDEINIRVPEDLRRIGEKPPGYPGYDDIVLPESRDPVQIRPLTVGDVLAIEGRDKNAKMAISTDTAMCIWGILSIGGHEYKPSSIDEVNAWFKSLGPTDSTALFVAMDDLDPHLSSNMDFVCDGCSYEYSVALTFDNNFFRRRVRELSSHALVPTIQSPSQ